MGCELGKLASSGDNKKDVESNEPPAPSATDPRLPLTARQKYSIELGFGSFFSKNGRENNARFCTVLFQIFLRRMPERYPINILTFWYMAKGITVMRDNP